MAGNVWNADLFAEELRVRLSAALGSGTDAFALATAVGECNHAAEPVCHGRDMACAAGCPHCCVLNVSTLLPEALLIADWLQERLSPPELEVLKKDLSRHRSSTRWMTDDERIAKGMTCPFLNLADCCTIHPVRPLSCRGVASLDSDSCREALAPVITDEARLVVADLLRRSAYDVAYRVLGQVLKDRGLDHRGIELGSGVLAFLEEPRHREQLLRGARLPDELWQA